MQKFILTDSGEIRFGDVPLHRHLLHAGERCVGGGFWHIDYIRLALILSGSSMDYGLPQFSRFSTLFLPADYHGMDVIYTDQTGHERNLTHTHLIAPC